MTGNRIMFEDRQEAGKLLAKKLEGIINPSASRRCPEGHSGQEGFAVVPLLRGGIVLGKIISDYFNLPLMPLAVKKIGAPLNSELGIGAVTFDKTYYFNENIIRDLNISANYKETILESKYQEAKLLQEKIERNTEKISWEGKNFIIVDDGVAIGNTVICASLYFRKQKVNKIILATPVIGKESLKIIKKYFDMVVSLKIANNLSSISEFYKFFPQVEDKEVIKLM